MDLLPLIVLSLIALAAVAGLVTVIVYLARTNKRMGDQLIANSDFQVRRIELETTGNAQSKAAEAYRKAMDNWQPDRPLPNDIPGA